MSTMQGLLAKPFSYQKLPSIFGPKVHGFENPALFPSLSAFYLNSVFTRVPRGHKRH